MPLDSITATAYGANMVPFDDLSKLLWLTVVNNIKNANSMLNTKISFRQEKGIACFPPDHCPVSSHHNTVIFKSQIQLTETEEFPTICFISKTNKGSQRLTP